MLYPPELLPQLRGNLISPARSRCVKRNATLWLLWVSLSFEHARVKSLSLRLASCAQIVLFACRVTSTINDLDLGMGLERFRKLMRIASRSLPLRWLYPAVGAAVAGVGAILLSQVHAEPVLVTIGATVLFVT